ncbi:hypothetical protein G7Y89_g6765 [Cudoniella acicularis]|uniref:DUF7708 domain-containing protein n=1 Tax=Cudoniella acicularis TaxID=354080 RepID=A0A8H4RJT3_9HELO|nr:hypothetical protein G7Y89_g6765 [Cudoniella acicularis]
MSGGFLPLPVAVPPARPRLSGIVETYVRKRLPRGIHPAFKAVRNREEASTAISQIPLRDEAHLDREEHHDEANLDKEEQRPENDIIDAEKEEDLSLEEMYKDAESERERFKLAMESYEKTTAGSKFKTDVTSNSVHTWEEVLEEINRASENYSNVPGLWGKIRNGFRSFGKNHKAFTAWSTLLPSDSEYFSILCGGIKLAAARMHDLRQDICDALAEIPFLLMSTRRALGVFKKSKELHRCSSALYVATIEALHHIVLWYKEKAYKKITKSIFKQGSYGERLEDMLKAIRKQSELFEKSAKSCLYETSVNTNQEVKSQRIESRTNQTILVGYLDRSQTKIEALEEQVSGMREILAKFLSSNARIDFNTRDVRGPMLPLRKAASESRLIRDRSAAQDALLSAFDYESSVIRRDIEASLRGIWALPRPDQDRVVSIIQAPKLHKWIAETGSSALFINANYKGTSRRLSTSFVSAKLVDSIQPSGVKSQRQPSTTFPLSFFCGEHLGSGDPDSGVDGMMRSLLSQLLLAYPDFDLYSIDKMQSVNYDQVDDLCRMFYLLIAQLPPHILVFCIIDSISFFEENEVQCEESELVVQELADIVENTRDRGCTFKLLLTSPWNSRVLYKSLPSPERDVVWMPTKVPPQGGFTGMKWSASIGGYLG